MFIKNCSSIGPPLRPAAVRGHEGLPRRGRQGPHVPPDAQHGQDERHRPEGLPPDL
jgi:hypothetical protein